MGDLLPPAAGLVLSALVVAGLVVAGRALRRHLARRRHAEELRWARHRLRDAARAAETGVATWLGRRDGALRDALVAVLAGLGVVRDHLTESRDLDLPPVADVDALTARYAAAERLVTPVRDVVDTVAGIRGRLADLDEAGVDVTAALRDRVDALVQAVDDEAARLAATPSHAAGLGDARERLDRLARRGRQLGDEIGRRWGQQFPDRARRQGAELFDAWVDAVRQENSRTRPAGPGHHPGQTDRTGTDHPDVAPYDPDAAG